MDLPVCEVCAKSPILCSDCEKKLSDGVINEYDVEVSRVLYELFADDARLTRAIETQDYVVLLTKSEDVGSVIGEGGLNIQMISERLGRSVRVVGEGDFENMVKAFIAPARVKSINTVYRPRARKSVRVRIKRGDRGKLRNTLDDLGKLISSISDVDVELAFD